MKSLARSAVYALIAILSAPGAHAQLLVSPQLVVARHAGTDVFGTTPPTGAGNLDLWPQPTWFANSHTHAHSTPINGNEVSRSSGYDTIFFEEFSTGLVNRANIQGHAEARARVGGSSLINITATATSTTRVEFLVTQPVTYHLSGMISLDEVSGAGPGFGTAMAQVTLVRNGLTVLHNFTLNAYASGAVPFNVAGTLLPGSYVFTGESGVTGTATGLNALWASHSIYDANINFAPVPAPAAFVLIAGAGFLHARGRRRTV